MPAAKGSKSAGKAKRTTHRSTSGKKLYAVRDKKGRFKDIQTYKKAHAADVKKKSAKETTAAAKKAAPARRASKKAAPVVAPVQAAPETSVETMGEATAP